MKASFRSILVPITLLGLAAPGCASFTSGSIDLRQAVSSPGAATNDSVSVFVALMSSQESKSAFDYNFPSDGIQPVKISISNRNSSSVEFIPSSVPFYISPDQVHQKTKFNGGLRLFVWSIPWGINLLAGAPIYYGILWPIIGLVDNSGASDANDERLDFFNRVALKPIKLQSGQDAQGIVFTQRMGTQTMQLTLRKENGDNIVFDVYPHF